MSPTTTEKEKIGRGQGNELVNKFEAAGMTSAEAQAVIQSSGNNLATELVGFLRGKLVSVAMPFLCYTRHVSGFFILARTTPRNPMEFFQTRAGLYVWDDFKRLIVSAVSSTAVSAKEKAVEYYDLVKSATDAQIAADLDERHIFTDVPALLSYLASLIEAQWGGKDTGPLLTNGYANLFYVRVGTEVFAVRADWLSGDRKWGVRAYPLDGRDWRAGPRVFSSNEPSVA